MHFLLHAFKAQNRFLNVELMDFKHSNLKKQTINRFTNQAKYKYFAGNKYLNKMISIFLSS